MTVIMILKITLIIIYLIMFLRHPSLTWGIGLLAVTAAVLIDTLIFTFDNEALRAELGFFYFFLAGALFGGATLWIWGLFVPRLISKLATSVPVNASVESSQALQSIEADAENKTAVDNQMLFEEIQNRFGREDVLDLMFDLELNEVDVMPIGQDLNHLIINIMKIADQEGKAGALALAVERILTPPPAEHLPRLEKIDDDSPPTILRHYLLTHYTLENLKDMTRDLDIDWEQLDAGAKREKSRSLLQYLYRRNRIDELVQLMQKAELPTLKEGNA